MTGVADLTSVECRHGRPVTELCDDCAQADDARQPRQRITTRRAAATLPTAELARMFAASGHSPQLDTAEDELEAVALMAELRDQLDQLVPAALHRAVRSGASPDQAAQALGDTVPAAAAVWRTWASQRRRAWITSPNPDAGMSPDEHGQVAEQWLTAERPWTTKTRRTGR